MGLPKTLLTEDQYLGLERESQQRHIYVDGEIFAMAGESGAHADITGNIYASLHKQLRGTPCRARTKDTKVRSGPMRLTDYVLVSHDRPQIEHFHREKNGRWSYEAYEGLEAVVTLSSIRCRLNAAEVYERLTFDNS
jgi:Uma2 family endonuclease